MLLVANVQRTIEIANTYPLNFMKILSDRNVPEQQLNLKES